MKLLNATFEVDNDLIEHKLRIHLESIGAKYLNTIPNTDNLKEDANYKKLVKAKKDAQLQLDRYINNQYLKAK